MKLEELEKILEIDKNGYLIWKHREDRTPQWNGRYAGKKAGKAGQVDLHGTNIPTARILWLLQYKEIPENYVVQRINKKSEFNLNNLECLSISDANRKKVTRHYKHIYNKGKGFKVEISLSGTAFYIGYYDTLIEAIKARDLSLEELSLAK